MATPTTTSLRTVHALRYVVPLREGGSLPGVVEASDLGTYVVKFRGAGQGAKVLVAEIVVGELARALGLPVPDLALIELDPALSSGEPDEEVQDLLRASAGLNLAMDYLPGSVTLDPSVDPVDPRLAAQVLWLDALVDNVDRTWRNPNLLLWHRNPWLIDHGASLWWHHTWRSREAAVTRELRDAEHHVLLASAGPLHEADTALAPQVDEALLHRLLALVPDAWLVDQPDNPGGNTSAFTSADEARQAYVEVLGARVAAREHWLAPLEALRRKAVGGGQPS
ncbi:MAG TPA: HipA family kinase [Actinomycetales bacterium]|nr:HipA family kinase [Actinomycetales bacterium]